MSLLNLEMIGGSRVVGKSGGRPWRRGRGHPGRRSSMSRSRLKVTMTKELPGRGNGAQLLDALDGVDGLLDALGDLGLHLLGGRARQGGADRDGGQIDRREAIDAQAEIAGGADHHQRQDDHRREDRPADTNLGELLHVPNLSDPSHSLPPGEGRPLPCFSPLSRLGGSAMGEGGRGVRSSRAAFSDTLSTLRGRR